MIKKLSVIMAAAISAALLPLSSVSAYVKNQKANFSGSPTEVTIVRTLSGARKSVLNTWGYSLVASRSNPAGTANVPTAASITIDETPDETEKLKGTATVDFKDITFSAPGDYEYTIKETSSIDEVAYPIDKTTYTVGVSVRNNAAYNGYVASLYVKDAKGNKLTDFSGDDSGVIFSYTYQYSYIELTAKTTGEDVDKNKCFAYKVNFSTLDSEEYTLSESTCADNEEKIKDGSIIYLKDGDTVVIGVAEDKNEILVGTEYSFEKIDDEEFQTLWDGKNSGNTSNMKQVGLVNSSKFDETNRTTVEQNLPSIPNTGLFFKAIPYILLIVGGATIIIAFNLLKHAKNKR